VTHDERTAIGTEPDESGEFDALPLERPAWYDDELPSIEQLCREQGVTPLPFSALWETYPLGTPEEEAAFDRAMEELRRELR
jgi:hypothetical protein